MEALNRKPDLSPIPGREITLPDGTHIQRKGMTVAESARIENNKALSQFEQGMHLMAARMLVNGKPVCYDDVANGFSTDEFEQISRAIFPELHEEDSTKNG